MRREPHLSAELRREDEDEKREQELRLPFPAEEESFRKCLELGFTEASTPAPGLGSQGRSERATCVLSPQTPTLP